MRFAYGLAVVLLASCALFADQSDDHGAPDAANPKEVCLRARSEWRQIAGAIDRSCALSSDCVAIGAVDTCDCTAHLANDCSGDPVSLRGLSEASSQLRPRENTWAAFSCASNPDVGEVCDCAPTQATCVNNQCVAQPPPSCFPPPPNLDAGV